MNIKNALLVVPLCLGLFTMADAAFAQTKFEEVLPYQDKDGYIVIHANVGGREGDFLLNTNGGVQVSESAAKSRNMTPDATGKAAAFGFFVGKNLYKQSVSATVIKDNPLFTKLGVDGVIGVRALTNCVLTLNTKIKTITISSPYRPSYMKLENRGDLQVKADGIYVDLNTGGKITTTLAEIFPIPANSFLKNGVVSFDGERGKFYFQPFGNGEETVAPVLKIEKTVVVPGKVNAVDRDYFLANIHDYRTNKEWKTIGDKPVVIDFWATWCGPCMRMMPIMEELAAKYKDQIIFYKVNVDKEGELRETFKANVIPMMFFAPVKGAVLKEVGADSKEKVEERLKAILNK